MLKLTFAVNTQQQKNLLQVSNGYWTIRRHIDSWNSHLSNTGPITITYWRLKFRRLSDLLVTNATGLKPALTFCVVSDQFIINAIKTCEHQLL